MSKDHEKTMALFNQSGQFITILNLNVSGILGKIPSTRPQFKMTSADVVIICPATPSAKAHVQKTNWLAMFLEVFFWWGRHFKG